jgi:hypothetical protein
MKMFEKTSGCELDQISEALTEAQKHGLEAEVVHSLIQFIKDNPETETLEGALNYAFCEWDI